MSVLIASCPDSAPNIPSKSGHDDRIVVVVVVVVGRGCGCRLLFINLSSSILSTFTWWQHLMTAHPIHGDGKFGDWSVAHATWPKQGSGRVWHVEFMLIVDCLQGSMHASSGQRIPVIAIKKLVIMKSHSYGSCFIGQEGVDCFYFPLEGCKVGIRLMRHRS
jgi:hypothetical protein